jgi:hypothetical protein
MHMTAYDPKRTLLLLCNVKAREPPEIGLPQKAHFPDTFACDS